jgi:uncharacterized protein (DUF2147 family)
MLTPLNSGEPYMRAAWIALTLAILPYQSAAQAPTEAITSVVGDWHTISDADRKPRAIVRVQMVGEEIRGFVAGTLRQGEDPNRVCDRCPGALRNRPISGMTILWGLHRDPANPREFINGSVLDPETGDTYSASLKLSPDGKSLELRGYFVLPIVGRSQTWLRAP